MMDRRDGKEIIFMNEYGSNAPGECPGCHKRVPLIKYYYSSGSLKKLMPTNFCSFCGLRLLPIEFKFEENNDPKLLINEFRQLGFDVSENEKRVEFYAHDIDIIFYLDDKTFYFSCDILAHMKLEDMSTHEDLELGEINYLYLLEILHLINKQLIVLGWM